MTFLATLIALLMERFFHWNQLRQWRWFFKYQKWVDAKIKLSNPGFILAVYTLPISLLVGIISYLFCGWLLGLVYLVFATAILFYCLGPNNLWAQVYQCMNELNQGDSRKALETAQKAFGISLPENTQSFHQAFLRELFIAVNQRIFAVIFWFAILGPLGAILYRTIELSTAVSPSVAAIAIKVIKILNWLPARIVSFLFALTGNFSKVFAHWKMAIKQGLNANDTVLINCGFAAIELSEAGPLPENGSVEKEALLLFDRTFVLALVILAVMTLLI
jgi:AmpE protein